MNEEFDKWREEANKNDNSHVYRCDSDALNEAFLAGAAAMREKCAEVAEKEANTTAFHQPRLAAKNIAATIRKLEV